MVYFDVWGGMLGILFGIDTFVLSLFLIFFYFCFCGVWEILFLKREKRNRKTKLGGLGGGKDLGGAEGRGNRIKIYCVKRLYYIYVQTYITIIKKKRPLI